MKRFFKRLVVVLAVSAGLALLVAAGMMLATDIRLAKAYVVEPQAPAITANEADVEAEVEAGRHLAEVYCTRCHGDNLAGGPFFAMDNLGIVDAPNLTRGVGGIGATYRDVDWVRAICHGVRPDGKPLFIMPSADFQYISEADLAALIAYLRRVPPVDNRTRPRTFTPLARLLYTAGAFGNLLPAERIDHAASRPFAPRVGPTAEYGAYIVALGGCRTCHGQNLAGGKDSDPAAPPAPNLTPGGELSFWREADFAKLLRHGTTPSGRQLSRFMPWQALSHLNDEELRALWLYLQSLPAQTS